jgi:hypothetical protein
MLARNVDQSLAANYKKHEVDNHLGKCMDVRRIRDWKSFLREADVAIANRASSQTLNLVLFFILKYKYIL